MKQEGLKYFQHTDLTVIAMLLFFAVFMGMLIWVLRRTGKEHYDKMARIPLSDEAVEEGGASK